AVVWSMVELQLLTGARPGEICSLRTSDIDRSGRIWTATPADHKNAHRGHARTIYFGPRAQAVLTPFLQRDLNAFIFSPREAEAQRHAQAKVHRRPDQKPNPRKTARRVGDRYETAAYRRAIARACAAAGVPAWHPHQLRHSAATNLRKEFG